MSEEEKNNIINHFPHQQRKGVGLPVGFQVVSPCSMQPTPLYQERFLILSFVLRVWKNSPSTYGKCKKTSLNTVLLTTGACHQQKTLGHGYHVRHEQPALALKASLSWKWVRCTVASATEGQDGQILLTKSLQNEGLLLCSGTTEPQASRTCRMLVSICQAEKERGPAHGPALPAEA